MQKDYSPPSLSPANMHAMIAEAIKTAAPSRRDRLAIEILRRMVESLEPPSVLVDEFTILAARVNHRTFTMNEELTGASSGTVVMPQRVLIADIAKHANLVTAYSDGEVLVTACSRRANGVLDITTYHLNKAQADCVRQHPLFALKTKVKAAPQP